MKLNNADQARREGAFLVRGGRLAFVCKLYQYIRYLKTEVNFKTLIKFSYLWKRVCITYFSQS